MCSCIFASSTDQRKLVGNPQDLRAQWFAGEFESFCVVRDGEQCIRELTAT